MCRRLYTRQKAEAILQAFRKNPELRPSHEARVSCPDGVSLDQFKKDLARGLRCLRRSLGGLEWAACYHFAAARPHVHLMLRTPGALTTQGIRAALGSGYANPNDVYSRPTEVGVWNGVRVVYYAADQLQPAPDGSGQVVSTSPGFTGQSLGKLWAEVKREWDEKHTDDRRARENFYRAMEQPERPWWHAWLPPGHPDLPPEAPSASPGADLPPADPGQPPEAIVDPGANAEPQEGCVHGDAELGSGVFTRHDGNPLNAVNPIFAGGWWGPLPELDEGEARIATVSWRAYADGRRRRRPDDHPQRE